MPRSPFHALIWSSKQRLYELYTQGQLEQRFRSADEATWLAWLREATSFAFHGAAGSLNVYHETRPHGGLIVFSNCLWVVVAVGPAMGLAGRAEKER